VGLGLQEWPIPATAALFALGTYLGRNLLGGADIVFSSPRSRA
jgi:hypothetical protein